METTAMSNSESWASIIPEFYYDLISRIPAGLTLIAIVIIGGISSDQRQELITWLVSANHKDFPFLLIFILLICAGYTISIPLSALGAIAHLIYSRKVWKNIENTFCNEIRLLEKHYNSGSDKTKLNRLLHDDLKNRNPQAKVILSKMQSEVALCDNLAAAIAIGFIIDSV